MFTDVSGQRIPEEHRYHQHRGGSLKSRLGGGYHSFEGCTASIFRVELTLSVRFHFCVNDREALLVHKIGVGRFSMHSGADENVT
jgi:hypothetical protein